MISVLAFNWRDPWIESFCRQCFCHQIQWIHRQFIKETLDCYGHEANSFLFTSLECKKDKIYVSLQLRVQNRRRKWHFPPNFQNVIIWTSPFRLNIRNAINWAGAFSKAFSSSEALTLVLSKNACLYSLKMPACMIIFQILFSQKHCTLY